tara:strand:- start:337 stop:1005 length:669 start_codon:yes stop_codon:yes gene_type:complete
MDNHIVFYDYKTKNEIIIDNYNEGDKLNSDNIKKKFVEHDINFEKCTFIDNFVEISKNIYLKNIVNLKNIIIINNSIIKKNDNIDIDKEKKPSYKYFGLLKKYPDLMLFVYMINNNNLDDIIYFLKKYYIKNKLIFNIIKNNQNELIDMMNSQPDIIVDFFKKTDNIYNYSFNFDFSSVINYFASTFSTNSVIYELEDLFPDVPLEKINELINVFKDNVLII